MLPGGEKIPWQTLVASTEIDHLVPESQAAFRALVREAMVFFLERLPLERQVTIAVEQLALPADAGAVDRLVPLLHRCPTLHKMGQILARDPHVPPDLRAGLQRLEQGSPTSPVSRVVPALRRALGRDFSHVDFPDSAIAEASVALVVPFTHRDPRTRRETCGVFKVLKPGIRERMTEELSIWSTCGPWLRARAAHHGLPVPDLGDVLARVTNSLEEETRLDREQDHMRAAHTLYAGSSGILVPRLMPWCSPEVTAMDRVDGVRVTEACGPSAEDRNRRAERLVLELLARPFFGGDAALFHADPHAGNLFWTHDGKLALLDWSLAVRIDTAHRDALIQIVLGGMTHDPDKIRQALGVLAAGETDSARSVEVARAALRRVRRGRFPGFGWLVELLDDTVTSGALMLSEPLVVLRKAMLSLKGVVLDIAPWTDIDQLVHTAALTQLALEAPRRCLLPIGSRELPTRLSSGDIAELLATWPLAVARRTVAWLTDHTSVGDTPHP